MNNRPISCMIILSAGLSSRMGSPKQNLIYQGETLLHRSLAVADKSKFDHILTVTGPDISGFSEDIQRFRGSMVSNPTPERGIGSSIKTGLIRAVELYQPDFIGIMLIDQPFLTVQHLDLLLKYSQNGNAAVSKYQNGIAGVPAVFPKSWFDSLKTLKEDKGAGNLIRNSLDQCEIVDFPNGNFDIDTPEDFDTLLNYSERSKQS